MAQESHEPTLDKRLSLTSATLLVVGTIIGAGVFSTPGFVAATLGAPWLIILAWVLGGAISLAGALSYAELGAAWPDAGGHYVYMRRAYGPFWGFLDGWTAMLINFPGSIAAMSIALAAYLGELIAPLAATRVILSIPAVGNVSVGQVVVVITIGLLSGINHLGIREGAWVQNVVTGLKVVVFAVFIIAGLIAEPATPGVLSSGGSETPFSVSALGVALIAVMFTYFGWDSATYVAGEVRNPRRNLPLAALWGTLGVTAIYVALNVVFLRAVPAQALEGSVVIADVAARSLFGPVASRLVTVAVIVSILGGLNAMVMTGPRVIYAMSRDGVFFSGAGRLDEKRRTPARAIWIQAGVSAVLAFTGTFEALFTAAGFVITLLAGATAIGVLVLRRREPNHPRPYRTWGAPATPILFALAALWIGISSIIEQPIYSVAGLAVIGSAWPAYRLWRRRDR